jgi:hypothetical protein
LIAGLLSLNDAGRKAMAKAMDLRLFARDQ